MANFQSLLVMWGPRKIWDGSIWEPVMMSVRLGTRECPACYPPCKLPAPENPKSCPCAWVKPVLSTGAEEVRLGRGCTEMTVDVICYPMSPARPAGRVEIPGSIVNNRAHFDNTHALINTLYDAYYTSYFTRYLIWFSVILWNTYWFLCSQPSVRHW